MVEKVPKFSAESLCLRQGMVTSGRWCHYLQFCFITALQELVTINILLLLAYGQIGAWEYLL